MGVYDFFKGTCPKCFNQINNHPQYGLCGDIQTKYFIIDEMDSFRSFYPGSKVPFAPDKDFIIGKTCCCNTLIKAIFNWNILTGYQVASYSEVLEYNRMKSERQARFNRLVEEKLNRRNF
jgi:hypothetical protein